MQPGGAAAHVIAAFTTFGMTSQQHVLQPDVNGFTLSHIVATSCLIQTAPQPFMGGIKSRGAPQLPKHLG